MSEPSLDIIDPHLHVWQLKAGHYHWLRSDKPPIWPDKALLQQDYLPDALQLSAPFRLAGAVAIEAGFDNNLPERELHWLSEQSWPCAWRSVAFLDCAAPLADIERKLAALLPYQPAGVRHIFENEDEAILHGAQLDTVAKWLQQHQLLLEVQCDVSKSANTLRILQLAGRYPGLRLVLNHASLVQPTNVQAWQRQLGLLAEYNNIAMKLSGWEMLKAGRQSRFEANWLRQVLDMALNQLPSQQLMLASNFPLCLWQGSYQQLWQRYFDTCQQLGLSGSEWQQLSKLTASYWYSLR
ncbi:MAG: amidohydrolase family protein [Alkalimonas sp.]|nr:amidohydrolase family protein [Alkalimonas sp.]